MDARLPRPILVVSTDWKTCTMLAAQLGETCNLDVVIAPGIDEALSLVRLVDLDPALLGVDAGSDISPDDVARLASAIWRLPRRGCYLEVMGWRPTESRTAPMAVGYGNSGKTTSARAS